MRVVPASLQTILAGQPSVVHGLLFMTLATLGAASLAGVVRYLSGQLHPFELAFFRLLFGLLVLMPWFAAHGRSALRTERIGLHLLRATVNVLSMLMYFLSLSLTPLAQVQALTFTSPLFATLLAILLLGEKVRRRRWAALAAGFTGMLIIIRPGVQTVDVGMLLALGSAAIWGGTLIVIKRLTQTESSLTITLYMTLFMVPLALLPALFVWVWPTGTQWLWLILGGALGTLAQLAMAQALRVAEATAVLPADFLKLIWGALIGYIFFAEVVDGWTWIGAVIIFSGSFYIAYRERQLALRKTIAAKG